MKLSRRAFLIGASSLTFGQTAFAGVPTVVIGGQAFGGTWRAMVPKNNDIGKITEAFRLIIESVDAAMSPFRQDSEISQFNASENVDWFGISTPIRHVIGEALCVARLSGGAFDPTIGGVVGQYGFGPIVSKSEADYTGISVDTSAVRKVHPDMSLDLCGIAKGYALDRMAEILSGFGLKDFLVEVGGEIVSRGLHPQGRPWQVAIENPSHGKRRNWCILTMSDGALATSGDRVNSYFSGGRIYSHIIDPHRRHPVVSDLASVSVLAGSAMRADALATALFAMGRVAGPKFAELERLNALFLIRDGKDIRAINTGSFMEQVLN